MRLWLRWVVPSALIAVLALPWNALAHFGVILPSDDIVTQEDTKNLVVEVKFVHPMEGAYMAMAKPKRFGVVRSGEHKDLLPLLKEAEGKGPHQEGSFTYWKGEVAIGRPGDYVFYVEPAPYWEPAEDKYIVHYTKVCVNALGLEEGWDEPVGLETEIVPLSRPYGLWTGNIFTGRVLLEGRPVPHAEIEVEYLNESPGNPNFVQPPSDPFVTQVIRADEDGIFHYAMPRAGWWGFAALSDASWKLERQGVKKDVEIGAVFWVRTTDMR